MKLMVIGSGGREHAIVKKLKENREVEVIYALPGNGGMAGGAGQGKGPLFSGTFFRLFRLI